MKILRRNNFYVYFHLDKDGNIFYVGKGTGKRAWSKDRHEVWNKYVDQRLNGEYEVKIHKDGLTEEQAESLEDELIAEHGEKLVNWINPKRDFDYDAIAKFHRLRDENRLFVEETRKIEVDEPEKAVEHYRQALQKMIEYESLTLERGLVAELGAGPDWGDPNILDRLTLSLIKIGRGEEAIEETHKYFNMFPSAQNLKIGKRIKARVDKLQAKLT